MEEKENLEKENPNSLYPNLNEYQKPAPSSVAPTTFMNEKRKQLEDKLNHYQKLKNKWGKADVIIKSIGIGLIFTTTIGSVIISTGGLISPVIFALLSGFTAGEAFISEGLVIGLTSKNKSKYRKKCEEINNVLNKTYVHMQKVNRDGIITEQELNEFCKICNVSQSDDGPSGLGAISADERGSTIPEKDPAVPKRDSTVPKNFLVKSTTYSTSLSKKDLKHVQQKIKQLEKEQLQNQIIEQHFSKKELI